MLRAYDEEVDQLVDETFIDKILLVDNNTEEVQVDLEVHL